MSVASARRKVKKLLADIAAGQKVKNSGEWSRADAGTAPGDFLFEQARKLPVFDRSGAAMSQVHAVEALYGHDSPSFAPWPD